MIIFKEVSKIYKEKLIALDRINFQIEDGEFVFLIGPSGSGKSTIIKLLIRDEDPTEGQIFFDDLVVSNLKESEISKLRRQIGVIFQDFKLLPQMNLFENIAFALEISNRRNEDIEETVNYLLDIVNLSDRKDAFPSEISGGEKQKIAIARALANNPKVLIADEPTGNLDPQSTKEIMDLLLKINNWGTTVIMATHGSNIVNLMNKRVIELNKGKIIKDSKNSILRTIKIPTEFTTITDNENLFKQANETKEDGVEKKSILTKTKNSNLKNKQSDNSQLIEKEFDLSFSIKSKKQSKKKKKDEVDLKILELDEELEKKLILNNITSIGQIKMLHKDTFKTAPFLSAKEKKLLTTKIKGIID